MGTIHVYTTGGELIEGPGSGQIESLIEELGVIPPWQACYCDPDAGILLHIVTLTRREAGSAARRANNYYIAVEDTTSGPRILWEELQTALERRLTASHSVWQEVPATEDLKSPLSGPSHISSTAELQSTPETLPEQAVEWHLKNQEAPLSFGFASPAGLRMAVGTYATANPTIVYGTQLDTESLEALDLRLEIGAQRDYAPLDTVTADRLERAVEKVAQRQRERHLTAIENALDTIQSAVATGTVAAETAIDVVSKARESPDDFDHQPADCLDAFQVELTERHHRVRREATLSDFAHYELITPLVEDHPRTFTAEVTDRIEATIEDLRSELISASATTFSEAVETRIAEVTADRQCSPATIDSAISRYLFEESHAKGLTDQIRGFVMGESTGTEPSADLQTAMEACKLRADEQIIPKLAASTRLDQDTTRERFFSALEIDSTVAAGDENS